MIKRLFMLLQRISVNAVIYVHRCRIVLVACVLLTVLLPVPTDARRISVLPPGKAAVGVSFGSARSVVVIEKNLDNFSRDEDFRIQSHTSYSDQVLLELLTLQWTRFSDDFGYWISGGIAGGYHTGYEDPLDLVDVGVEIGLYKPLGALKPYIDVLYTYAYDTLDMHMIPLTMKVVASSV